MPATPRARAALFLLLATVSTLIVSAPITARADACGADPKVDFYQPVDNGVLKVARVGGQSAGDHDMWDSRLDAWFCNPTDVTLIVTNALVQHRRNGSTYESTNTTPIIGAGDPAVLDPHTDQNLVFVRDDTLYAFPLPDQIRVTFTLKTRGGSTFTTIVKTFSVALYQDAGPLHAYFFPAKQSDLPDGAYWAQSRHAEDNNFQRWAYDLNVERWTGSAWTSLVHDGDDPEQRQSYLVFNRPVYAMSNGEIIGCNRGGPDNDPADKVGNVPGGNLLWIRTGNETTLYAHLKQFSIPFSLCPYTDDKEHKEGDPNQNLPGDQKFKVRAGQYLGRTGTSGFSRDFPHLHIHVFKGLPGIWGGSETGIDADARPLEFLNVRSQAKTSSDVGKSKWNPIDVPAILPYNSRFEVNDCGIDVPGVDAKEAQNAAVPPECFGQMYNAMVQGGMRPVVFDSSTKKSGQATTTVTNSVWRPAGGVPWVLLAGLNGSQYQDAYDTWVKAKSFRILQVDSYPEAGKVKYVVVFVKQPGPTQSARHGLTPSALQDYFDTKTAHGYAPVVISAAPLGGKVWFTAIMEKADVGSFIAKANVKVSNYQQEYDDNFAAGRRLAYLDGYVKNGTPYLSVIFYGKIKGSTPAKHGIGASTFRSKATQNVANGHLTRGVTAYMDGGSLRFAAFWRGAPNTSISGHPNGTTTSNKAQFTFGSTEPLSTFSCKRDGGPYKPCTSPTGYANLAAGQHTFRVRATDRQGVADATPATWTWTVLSKT